MAVNTGKIQGKHRESKPERGHPDPPGWHSSERPLLDPTGQAGPVPIGSPRKASFHLVLPCQVLPNNHTLSCREPPHTHSSRAVNNSLSTNKHFQLRVPHRGAAPQAANQRATLLEWEVCLPLLSIQYFTSWDYSLSHSY